MPSATSRSLDDVRSIEDLSPNPLVYDRAAFMAHIRRYDRDALRDYYLRQDPKTGHVLANYVVNLWEYEHGVDELTSYPWNVTVPITEVCNATCSFCSSPLVVDPKALALHEIGHFSEALRHALRVSLQGLGEPLAHPFFDDIATELRRLLNPIARLEIITNGWLLDERRWGLLKSLRVRVVQVSVNAASDRTHQIVMGSRPGTFDRVLANIERVKGDPTWRCFVKASMVITRHSLPEVPQFLELLTARGVKAFQFNAPLPLTSPDWGFGRTGQYLDLWCGHLPDAPELVERATRAIAQYREGGASITASPQQWLDRVDQWEQPELIQLTTEQGSTAAFQGFGQARPLQRPDALRLRIDDRDVPLTPHVVHAMVTAAGPGAVEFQSTSRAGSWAYLLVMPPTRLRAGRYRLWLDARVHVGELYVGILDVARDEFFVQQPLGAASLTLEFEIASSRLVQVIIRQGALEGPVAGVFERAWVEAAAEVADAAAILDETPAERPAAPGAATIDRGSLSRAGESEPVATPVTPSPAPSVSKPGRIFCPMVYTTLSVFHHSLDVSTCCYMDTPVGEPPNLKTLPVLQAYNDPGFRLVRRTLAGDSHLPVCESCTYGPDRSA